MYRRADFIPAIPITQIQNVFGDDSLVPSGTLLPYNLPFFPTQECVGYAIHHGGQGIESAFIFGKVKFHFRPRNKAPKRICVILMSAGLSGAKKDLGCYA